jgi:hypothetical protein
MYRTLIATAIGTLAGLAALGEYVEKHDLDYCVPARRLRWMVWREERKQKRKRRKYAKSRTGTTAR